ncbi:hypothetical protein KQH42_19330 [Streptomyces sp. CHA1]|uniref:hypothetical protein n=1 Tax=unclassified Streptomyces TaxID=2593676 RepID=UPI001BFC4F73|nr:MULTISPECIES: hypothetical protein [unclassified Streptomyces]MBT3156161.1 hypothetical protein [Streptomyces sp. G11C]MCO6702518.1 hypothetical protein [Streptomyces sp. CHB9.2]MCO6708882.1 hypothetical protein [Streptomyces sp. CHA3]MCO6714675.1 hypothetical protein [Streptomyces sp. CHB19.2]MCO6720796.1 hypothetical protein [Streptomyces sp. Vc714c-19]
MSSSPRSWRRAGAALRAWRTRQWTVAGVGALATAIPVGAPTDVVPNPLFGRSVPVQWWNYPALVVTAVLAGIVLSTYVRRPSVPSGPKTRDGGRLGAAGGVLSFFAVGCPVCNKLVLVLLGASGALSYWAPLQPLLALVSAGLLTEAALRRLSLQTACPVTASA